MATEISTQQNPSEQPQAIDSTPPCISSQSLEEILVPDKRK